MINKLLEIMNYLQLKLGDTTVASKKEQFCVCLCIKYVTVFLVFED